MRLAALGAAVACVVLGSQIAGAEERRAPAGPARKVPTQEVSGGVDATAHSWSVYAGYTSTFGSNIRENGWRYRITSGYGQYGYTSSRWTGAASSSCPSTARSRSPMP